MVFDESEKREQLEARLLAELHQAQLEYQSASEEEKCAARIRYIRALQRFTRTVIYREDLPDEWD